MMAHWLIALLCAGLGTLLFMLGMAAEYYRARSARGMQADAEYARGWEDGRHIAQLSDDRPPPPPPAQLPDSQLALPVTTGELRLHGKQLAADLAAIEDWGSAVALDLNRWYLALTGASAPPAIEQAMRQVI